MVGVKQIEMNIDVHELRIANELTTIKQRLAGLVSSWIRGGVGQTTLVHAIGQTDITGFTPGGTPRVLDLPEGLASGSISTITDSQDTMVQRGTTGGGIHDTAAVELEDGLIGFDGNRDWLNSNGSLQSIFTTDGNISKTGDDVVGHGGALSDVARVWTSSGIRIFGFRADRSLGTQTDIVLEGIVHQTTIASLVALGGRTVDQLLFTDFWELTSLQEVQTFNGTRGGERPARTTLFLVLDRRDGTLGRPIDGIWDGSLLSTQLRVLAVTRTQERLVTVVITGVTGLEFSGGQISESVDGHREAAVLQVVGTNDVIVEFECVIS